MNRKVSAPLQRPQRDAGPGDSRGPLTPGDWIASATELLIDHGVDAVRVDALARQLGVTRGSFYWHFKDRDDLLRSMLNAWRDAATEQIIKRFDDRHSDPRMLIKELISLPFRGRSARRAASIELAIRGWARRDAMALQQPRRQRRHRDELDAILEASPSTTKGYGRDRDHNPQAQCRLHWPSP